MKFDKKHLIEVYKAGWLSEKGKDLLLDYYISDELDREDGEDG